MIQKAIIIKTEGREREKKEGERAIKTGRQKLQERIDKDRESKGTGI